MKSLAIIGLALLSGSATASTIYADNELGVQGNHNTGIIGVNDRNAHLGNNGGIINIFGKDGNRNAPGNNGFINVLPFHIVRDDDIDNELHVQGNHNTGIIGVNDKNAHLGNNGGIINVFGKDGKKSAPGNKGFINVLPFHIVRDDELADNQLNSDHLIIKNQKGGQVTINDHSQHHDDADNELALFINMSNNAGKVNIFSENPENLKDVVINNNNGEVTTNKPENLKNMVIKNNKGKIGVTKVSDDGDNELAISINMSGNAGKVNINSSHPENLRGVVINNNKGEVTTNSHENLKNMVIKNNHGKIGVTHPKEEEEEDQVESSTFTDMAKEMNSLKKAMHNLRVAHDKAFLGK